MGKNKNPDGEHPLPPKNEALPNEIERRLTTLENSISALEKNALERHARIITWIFSAVAFVVGISSLSMAILSSSSRSDSRAAATEMKQDVKDKLEDVEKRFQVLAGEALKKPVLVISDSQGLLDGRVFEIPQNSPVPFSPLFFKNIGDKRTEPLSVQLFSSVDLFQNGNQNWMRTPTENKDFPFCYFSPDIIESRTAGVGIAPQDTHPLSAGYERIFVDFTNVITCKLQVFYGADKPAEAKFVIKIK